MIDGWKVTGYGGEVSTIPVDEALLYNLGFVLGFTAPSVYIRVT